MEPWIFTIRFGIRSICSNVKITKQIYSFERIRFAMFCFSKTKIRQLHRVDTTSS